MTKIKICGLKREEDIQYVNESLPDYIGFVFAKSKRQVDDELAERLKTLLSPKIKAVGVFVNDDVHHIARLANNHTIDIIQLHGDEDKDYITTLKKLTPAPIIKAIRVRTAEDIINQSDCNADFLLLDAYVQDEYGGSGKTFDTGMIPSFVKEYFLAGGINSENVESIINKCHPYCIDLSSSVETDGIKDKEKIKQIIKLIRNTN